MTIGEATILMVDDEPLLLSLFAAWMTAVGCGKVYTAADGEAALAILSKTPVHLLITDVRMPAMDGVTLARQVAELGKPVPSIFISGFGDVDQREMYSIGVEAFLSKPSMREELLAVMRQGFARRSDLWLTPMDAEPKQSMLIECLQARHSADCSFRLGRGGFSVEYSGQVIRGKVAFRCLFPLERRELTGTGHVRWRSKSDRRVGVEFAFLDASCRSWIAEEIDAANSISFIPN